MTTTDICSPTQLLSKFYSLQAERVQAYQLFEEGFQAYLAGAPNYNFPLYRQLVFEITQGFSKISEEILTVKTEFAEQYSLSEVARIIDRIQDLEKTKLQLTAKLQIAVQNQKDHPAEDAVTAEVTDLKQRLKVTVEKIVDQVEDLKYESEELYQTDDIHSVDSTLVADR